MIQVRRSEERGHLNFGWLDTYHSFSFGEYYDPRFMGFRTLRVINQDEVAPGMGFPTHPHKDMEIITYVTHGTVEHKDSLGTVQQVVPGQIQVMSAGTGIRHSEYNPSKKEPLKLLQIWVLPEKPNLKPRYSDLSIKPESIHNQLGLIVSPDGRNNSAMIHQDAYIYACKASSAIHLTHELAEQRAAWIQVISGQVQTDGQSLSAGDGAAIVETAKLDLSAAPQTEFLLFDLGA